MMQLMRGTREQQADNEFLPAALEILETPASPVRVALLWFICLLATAALLWSYFGKIDVVAVASGKLQPEGRVRVVQALEAGKVKALHVTNGDRVSAGQVLVELDPTQAEAEVKALEQNLAATHGEVVRRTALEQVAMEWQGEGWKQAEEFPGVAFPTSIPERIRLREQGNYRSELNALRASLANIDTQRQQKQAETARLERSLAAQRVLVNSLEEHVAMYASLAARKNVPRATVLEVSKDLQEAQVGLATMTGQLGEARKAIEVLDSQAQVQIDSFVNDNRRLLSEAQRRKDELEQQRVQARYRLSAMTLVSPRDGVVQALSVNTLGQVVAAGSEVMRIVPQGGPLEVEAYLANQDIGFVEPGQPVVAKITAFPFTRYGVIEGKVVKVASDAIPESDAQRVEGRPTSELRSGGEQGSARPMQNLVFPILVALDDTSLNIDGRTVPLSAGMQVSVEIKTNKRRILEYLFSPVVAVTSQAMRER